MSRSTDVVNMKRKQGIFYYIRQKKLVSRTQLAQKFGISLNGLYHPLKYLMDNKKIAKKRYGQIVGYYVLDAKFK